MKFNKPSLGKKAGIALFCMALAMSANAHLVWYRE